MWRKQCSFVLLALYYRASPCMQYLCGTSRLVPTPVGWVWEPLLTTAVGQESQVPCSSIPGYPSPHPQVPQAQQLEVAPSKRSDENFFFQTPRTAAAPPCIVAPVPTRCPRARDYLPHPLALQTGVLVEMTPQGSGFVSRQILKNTADTSWLDGPHRPGTASCDVSQDSRPLEPAGKSSDEQRSRDGTEGQRARWPRCCFREVLLGSCGAATGRRDGTRRAEARRASDEGLLLLAYGQESNVLLPYTPVSMSLAMLSLAVTYHDIPTVSIFRTIPLRPDKHDPLPLT